MTSDSESLFWEKLKSRCSQQAAQGAERLVGSAAPMLIEYPKKQKANERPSVIGRVKRGDTQLSIWGIVVPDQDEPYFTVRFNQFENLLPPDALRAFKENLLRVQGIGSLRQAKPKWSANKLLGSPQSVDGILYALEELQK